MDQQDYSSSTDQSNDSDYNNLNIWCDTDTSCYSTAELVAVIYHAVVPLYFILALLTHSFILRCLYKLSKKRQGYFYQVALAVSETVELCFMTLSDLMVTYTPLTTSYWMAFVNAKLADFLYGFGIFNTVFVSLVTAADRLLSMAAPIKYRQLSSPAARRFMIVCCVCLSLLLNSYNLFKNKVQCFDADYRVCVYAEDDSLKINPISDIVYSVHIAVLVLGMVTLIGSNVAMLRLYRRRVQKVVRMTTENDAKVAVRKRDESALMTLTASQSLFVSLNIIAVLVYYCVTKFGCSCCLCQIMVLAVVIDMVYMLLKLFNINLCVAINRIFRQQLLNDLGRCFGGRLRKMVDKMSTLSQREFDTNISRNRIATTKVITVTSAELKRTDLTQ